MKLTGHYHGLVVYLFIVIKYPSSDYALRHSLMVSQGQVKVKSVSSSYIFVKIVGSNGAIIVLRKFTVTLKIGWMDRFSK